MSRLIDGEHLKRSFLRNCIYDGFNIWKHIDKEPSVDAVEVVHGRDIYQEAKGHCEFKCSVCGAEIGVVEGGDLDGGKFNYCPNCGAKMDGEGKRDGN